MPSDSVRGHDSGACQGFSQEPNGNENISAEDWMMGADPGKSLTQRLLFDRRMAKLVEVIRRRGRSKRPEYGQTVLIHIGKCGGASVRETLKQSGLWADIFPVHVSRPVFREDLKYIILIRNPLTRAISAFNWRYKLVVTEELQMCRFPGEHEILLRYGNISALGEALFDADGRPRLEAHRDTRRIRHIREDIGYYLTALLDRCTAEQIEAVLMQENLDDDIRRVFGVENEQRIHENRSMRENCTLSDRARRNLIRFLHRDYEALTRLWTWGKIDRKSYLKAIESLDDEQCVSSEPVLSA